MLTFTADAGRTTASLTVRASDGDNRTPDAEATVALAVLDNQAPSAGGDILATAPDGRAVAITESAASPGAANIRLTPTTLFDAESGAPRAIRILSIDGGTLRAANGGAIDFGPAGTVLNLAGGGVDLRFTPTAGRETEALVRYVMVDPDMASLNSASSRARIAIAPVNDTPVTAGDAGAVSQNGALSVAAAAGVLANDSDPDTGDTLRVTAVNGAVGAIGRPTVLPSGALLTLNADGSYDYNSNGAFQSLAVGGATTDRFTYTVSGSEGLTSQADVIITVFGVNDAPVVAADTAEVSADGRLAAGTAGVLANDSDPDAGDTLRVTVVNGSVEAVGRTLTLASGALLRLSADGAWSYDPNGRSTLQSIG